MTGRQARSEQRDRTLSTSFAARHCMAHEQAALRLLDVCLDSRGPFIEAFLRSYALTTLAAPVTTAIWVCRSSLVRVMAATEGAAWRRALERALASSSCPGVRRMVWRLHRRRRLRPCSRSPVQSGCA